VITLDEQDYAVFDAQRLLDKKLVPSGIKRIVRRLLGELKSRNERIKELEFANKSLTRASASVEVG
jgi:predicted transcriptional regulator YdeE